MDITETLAPKSDQLNSEDLLTGARTFTVEKVTAGSAEQPVDIHLAEFPGRPFRPSKTVRRILVMAWGAEASNYVGRRMTLFRDPEVRYGGAAVGGIRVSHLSHIDKPMTISLTETRGKRKPHRVDPLPDAPKPAPTPATPPISDDDALDLTRSISEAATIADLDEIARDLKALELGGHRAALMSAWRDRKVAIEGAAK